MRYSLVNKVNDYRLDGQVRFSARTHNFFAITSGPDLVSTNLLLSFPTGTATLSKWANRQDRKNTQIQLTFRSGVYKHTYVHRAYIYKHTMNTVAILFMSCSDLERSHGLLSTFSLKTDFTSADHIGF